MSWFPDVYYTAAFFSFSKEALQINSWALPALLLTATSSSQQEKNMARWHTVSATETDAVPERPFPTVCPLLSSTERVNALGPSALHITLPWWRSGTGGAWLPRVPKVLLKKLPAPWHLSEALEHPLTLSTRPQYCSHLQFLSNTLSGTWIPVHTRIPAPRSITELSTSPASQRKALTKHMQLQNSWFKKLPLPA